MQNNNRKNQTTQLPVQVVAENSIIPILEKFFDGASAKEYESLLRRVLQSFICPDPLEVNSNLIIADVVHAILELTSLLRELEALKGGVAC